MLYKLVIGRIDFRPELERKQRVQILLDSSNNLPSTERIADLKGELGQDLSIGKLFFEKRREKFYFATIPDRSQDHLSNKWSFVFIEDIKPEDCKDYEVIIEAIKKLGYEPIK